MIKPGVSTFANFAGHSSIASVGLKPSTTNITFSVGIAAATTDEYVTKDSSGVLPTVTIENDIATFSIPQTHPYVGVGDKVVLSDTTEFYLNEKISTREWLILDAQGIVVNNLAATNVVSIDKTFNSLQDAIDGDTSGIFNLLGSHDLIAKNSTLRIMCYAMTDNIGGNEINISTLWVNDVERRIKIIVPIDIRKQCNSVQRHIMHGTGYQLTGSFIVTGRIIIVQYTDIEGLLITGTSEYGVQCESSSYHNWSATYCIIDGPNNGIATTSGTPPNDQVVGYNLVLNAGNIGINILHNAIVYNNTVSDSAVDGYSYDATTNLQIFNCIAQSSGSGADFEDNGAGGTVLDSCISEDALPAGSTNSVSGTTLSFINTPTYNYRAIFVHIPITNNGRSIANGIFNFETDLEGNLISSIPMIGAFYEPFSVQYAVANGIDTNQGGTFTYDNTTSLLTFSVVQDDKYMCAGFTVNGEYYLRRKISSTVWEIGDNNGKPIIAAAGATVIVDIVAPMVDIYHAIVDDGGGTSRIEVLLNDNNLVTLDLKVTLNCSTTRSTRGISTFDFITDKLRNLIIQTPNTLTGYYIDVNVSRRHDGKWRTVKVDDPSDELFIHSGGGTTFPDGFGIDVNNVEIDGLQIDADRHGVAVYTGGFDPIISNNIIRDCVKGIYFNTKTESDENVVINNIVFDCKEDGIKIGHNFGIDTIARFGDVNREFDITVTSFGLHDEFYRVKIFTETVEITTSLIRWSPGLLEIFHNNQTNMTAVLANLEEEIGVPWGVITPVGANMTNDLSALLKDGVAFTQGNDGASNKVLYIYNNTIVNCNRGIFIETLPERIFTNIVYLKNNLVQDSTREDYITSSVNPDTVISDSNVSSDQTSIKLGGDDNIIGFSAHFIDKPAKDYHVSLSDIYDNPTPSLNADSQYSTLILDINGLDREVYGWTAGAHGYIIDYKGDNPQFSIGSDVGNLDATPAGRLVDITDGIAIFSSAVLGDKLSVGDKVSYAASTGYLAERGTNNIWKIVDNVGVIPSDVSGASVTGINRVFNTIADISGVGAIPLSTLLGTRDLVANSINLTIWCADDGTDETTPLQIIAWTTNTFYRFKVRSPYDTSTQCIKTHRHLGKDGVGFKIAYAGVSVALTVDNSYTHIEGLIVEKTVADNNVIGTGLFDDVIIENNIVLGGTNGIVLQSTAGRNYAVVNICLNQSVDGIMLTKCNASMNTIIDSGAFGIRSNDALDIVSNNIIQNGGTSDLSVAVQRRVNNLTSDSGGDIHSSTLTFIDIAGGDYHLHRSDWQALNAGQNLGYLENDVIVSGKLTQYNIFRDIDGDELRTNNYSVGADSVLNLATKRLVYSCGVNAGNLKTGINSQIKITNTIAVFSETQSNINMGIGDEVDYDFDNKIVFLQQKINDLQWIVSDKFGESVDDIDFVDLNSIKHVFNDLSIVFDNASPNGLGQHLGSPSYPFIKLKNPRYQVDIACYFGISGHDEFFVADYDTDENHYIRVYTPFNVATECNFRQSHDGLRGGLTTERVIVNATSSIPAARIRTHYTRIEGLILFGNQSNSDPCLMAANVQNIAVSDNIMYNAQDGVVLDDLGHSDFILNDDFENGVQVTWSGAFFNTWFTQYMHGNFAATKLASTTYDQVTSAFLGDTDVDFSMIMGGLATDDESFKVAFHDGAVAVSVVEFTNTTIVFAGQTRNIRHIPGRVMRFRLVRGFIIFNDGTTTGGTSDDIQLYFLDEFDDGDYTNTGNWLQHSTSVDTSAASVSLRFEASDTYGVGHLKYWNENQAPLSGYDIGLSENNTYINNIIYGQLVTGMRTTGFDIVLNNTIDDCGFKCYENLPGDVLRNNIGSLGQIASYHDSTTLRSCIASDGSIDTNNLKGNIKNAIIVYVDSVSIFENRNYRPDNLSIDVKGTAINLTGNPYFKFNFDGSFVVTRGRFWDMGALEYLPNIAVFAVGRFTGDMKTPPTAGILSYEIVSIFGFSIMTMSADQTNERMGIGNKIEDLSNPFSSGCVIISKLSASRWIVADFTGFPIPSRIGAINSIKRVFNNLDEAALMVHTATYLGTKDLISINTRVSIACYDDEQPLFSENGARFNNFFSNVDNYLTILTPHSITSECNTSQRHHGKFNEGGYLLDISNSSGNGDCISIAGSDFCQIIGMQLRTIEGAGIFAADQSNITLAYNIIQGCLLQGISGRSIGDSVDDKDEVYNNLIIDCGGDGVFFSNYGELTIDEDESLNTKRSSLSIRNNTIVDCERGIYIDKVNLFYATIFDIRNNLVQSSEYRDYAVEFYNQFANIFPIKNLASDESLDVLPDDNLRIQLIKFINKAEGNFYLNPETDAIAIDNAEDTSSDPCFTFSNDIVGNPRDVGNWDIGAFENVDIVGEGDLIIGPIIIDGVGSEGSDADTLEIYLREPGPVGNLNKNFLLSVPDEHQFISIDDFGGDPDWEINAYIATKPPIDNLLIHVHGNRTFVGTFELLDRGLNTVTIETYRGEITDGPASLIYDGPFFDDATDQSELILKNIKVYSVDAATQPYLFNTTAATDSVRFINSIVQVNRESVLGTVTGYLQVINSIIVYRNNLTSFDVYLSLSTGQGSLLANSIVISNLASGFIDFKTTPTPITDEIHNSISFNYGGVTTQFNFDNLASKMFANLENTDPEFVDAELTIHLFDISGTMSDAFLPLFTSPVIDLGSNSFVTEPIDIIGNIRIYISGVVDTGPYELVVNQILFTADDIQSIFQDKLKVDYAQEQYLPTYTNKVYKDLFSQFVGNENFREEFSRESKIIIELKKLSDERRFLVDKKNVEIARYEAYFDLTNRSIIFSKNNRSFGKLISTFLDDGRYVFFFDEISHTFIVFLHDTYNKGLSGKRNILNNVRFGGPSTVSV